MSVFPPECPHRMDTYNPSMAQRENWKLGDREKASATLHRKDLGSLSLLFFFLLLLILTQGCFPIDFLEGVEGRRD